MFFCTKLAIAFKIYTYIRRSLHRLIIIGSFRKYNAEQKHLRCKKCEAKKNQRIKALLSTKAKKSVNQSAT